jgi:glucose/arabinose dehydrogenase
VLRTERRPFSDALVKQLQVPSGFRLSIFARDLGHPRMMAVDGDGTVFVTRPMEKDVIVLRDAGDGASPTRSTLVSGIEGVHGIALRDGRIYLAPPEQVVSLDPKAPQTAPTVFVTGLGEGAQHPNRTLGFGPDGALYVSVGSSCNACQETDPQKATLLRVNPDGSARTVFATGLRNTIGFDWHPRSGALWGMDHGTDWLGDDTPPEELNQIQQGKDYGWPFCWGDRKVDAQVPEPWGKAAERGATKQAYCAKSEAPVLGYGAHSAPISMLFYEGAQFPEDYRGSAFVAMHGSWNRRPAQGYEVVRIRFDGDRPVAFERFLHGFLIEDGGAHFGRPAGLAVAKDGSLLVSDDSNGVIYRVSYGGGG